MTTHHTELLPYFDRGNPVRDQREVAWKEKNYEKNHKAKEIWKDFWIIMAIRPADT